MKLFDSIGEKEETGEVEIRPPENSKPEEKETRLGKQVEQELMGTESENVVGSEASTGSDSGSSTSADLPGMSSSSSSNEAVSVEDVHSQNKKIIGLLEDIREEVRGGSDELL